MSTVTVRKHPWPLERWEDFGRRCQSLRERLSTLIRTLPESRGLTPAHINDLVKAHDRLLSAMIRAESLLARQHPEAEGQVFRIIHGAGYAMWIGCRGRVRRDAPVLTRERWDTLGRELQSIRAENSALLQELQMTAGATKEYIGRFIKVERAIDGARCRLDSLVFRQHPDWDAAGRVFFGPQSPA